MDRLWSPWRLTYVSGHAKEAGCVFCLPDPLTPDGDPAAAGREALVVHRGRSGYVVLNLYPYNPGHLLVVPYRHLNTLGLLETGELHELASLIQLSEAVLTEAYRPQGINVGINLGKAAGAGILEHLHVHLVPRWSGDTNFMTVAGQTRVLPEELGATVARLGPVFERLAPARSASTVEARPAGREP
jgi:ATP adenylyltransferase